MSLLAERYNEMIVEPINIASMPKTRKCALCGREFVPNSGTQKYCSEECAEQAKEVKKKRQRDFLRAFEPVMELQQQEYLTFSKAAILLGLALVRRSDIERMFDANPYNRVIPCSKPKKATPKKQRTSLRKNTNDVQSTDEVLEYYSGEEVMQTYKVKQSWLYASAKRHQIPMCRIAGRNYYSKKHIDAVFCTSVDLDAIVDWLTPQEVADRYGINLTAVRSYAHRHKIPSKREYGQTFYSQSHFDELRRTDLLADENYYTVEQVQELYGLTKANICHIVKVKHIEKTKVGRINLLLRSDVERVMAERKTAGF